MKKKMIIKGYDPRYRKYCEDMDFTDEEIQGLKSLTIESLYQHLKNQIGHMNTAGDTRFIPQMEIGRIRISMQLQYYLWCLREDNHTDHDKPMSEEEFNTIVGDAPFNPLVDIFIGFDKYILWNAGQAHLSEIVAKLHCIVHYDRFIQG